MGGRRHVPDRPRHLRERRIPPHRAGQPARPLGGRTRTAARRPAGHRAELGRVVRHPRPERRNRRTRPRGPPRRTPAMTDLFLDTVGLLVLIMAPVPVLIRPLRPGTMAVW